MTTPKQKKWYGSKDLEARLGPMTLARFFKSWRESEKMSQSDMAVELRMSRQYLNDIEHQRRALSLKKASEIAEILGVSQVYLLKLATEHSLVDMGMEQFEVEFKVRG